MSSTRKPVVKKRVVAKSTTAKKTVRATKVTLDAVKEVFSTQTSEPETVLVATNSVALFVNGNSKGTVDTTNQTLGDFAIQHAQRAGIRTFSVYFDGKKADTSNSTMSLAGVSKLEIVAKDSRG